MMRWKTKWMLFCYESGDSNNSMIAFRHKMPTTTMTKTVKVTMNNASIIIPRGGKKNWENNNNKKTFMALTYKWQILMKHEDNWMHLCFFLNSAHIGFPCLFVLSIRGPNPVFPFWKLNYINCYLTYHEHSMKRKVIFSMYTN